MKVWHAEGAYEWPVIEMWEAGDHFTQANQSVAFSFRNEIDSAGPPQCGRLKRVDDPAHHLRRVARDVQVFDSPPVRLQLGRHLLAFVIRLDPPGRHGRADHLPRLLM